MITHTQKGNCLLLVIVIIFIATAFVVYTNNKKAPIVVITPPPAPVGVCRIIPTDTVTIYNRPSAEATTFGTLSVGEEQAISGITDNGWYAFDPASAQAANIGVFRNRYIPPTGSFNREGDCTNLEKLVALPATTCFDMVEMDTPVYKTASLKGTILATLHSGDYLRAVSTIGQSGPDYSKYFVEVNSDQGTVTPGLSGWIAGGNVNFNGQCELPKK